MIQSDPTDLSGVFVGIVVDEPDTEKHRVPVFIPKLMPAIPRPDPITKQNETVNVTNLVTEIKTQEIVETTPYMWVYQKNIYDALPKVGDRVWVIFIDNLPFKGYCMPFNPYSDGTDITPTPPTLFTLVVGGESVAVKQGSSVMINLPSDLKAVLDTTDNEKAIINIQHK